MSHSAARDLPILDAATILGLPFLGHSVLCPRCQVGVELDDDSRPSLALNPRTDRFHCRACGIRGNVIDLVRAVLKVDREKALSWIGSWTTHRTGPTAVSYCIPDDAAIEIYNELLHNTNKIEPSSASASYLRARRLNLDFVAQYPITEIGQPQELWSWLRAEFGLDRLRAAGLVSGSGEFRFRFHRLLCFVLDQGRPVYLQGYCTSDNFRPRAIAPRWLACPVPFNGELLSMPHEYVSVYSGCIATVLALQQGVAAVGIPGTRRLNQGWFNHFRDLRRVYIIHPDNVKARRCALKAQMEFRRRGIIVATKSSRLSDHVGTTKLFPRHPRLPY